MCYNIARLAAALHGGPRGLSGFIRERLRALPKHEYEAGVREADFERFEFKRGTPATETYLAHTAASQTFHALPFDGNVTLIWGVDQRFIAADISAGWQGLTSGVRVVPIAGGHVAPLHDQINEFGHVLAELLA